MVERRPSAIDRPGNASQWTGRPTLRQVAGHQRISPTFLARLYISCLGTILFVTAGFAEGRMSVTKEGFRRTCPSAKCGSIGKFYEGESLFTFETVDGWTRVSPYFSAGCTDGKSPCVQSGPAECVPENGIRRGEFAEWIRKELLVNEPSQL